MRIRGRGRGGGRYGFRASIASVAAEAERRQRRVRVLRAFFMVLVILALGTIGYYLLTHREESLIQCLYMTVVTVTTVGFKEVIQLETDQLKGFTMILITLGAGSILYFLTAFTALFVEQDVFQRSLRRLRKDLDRQRNHVVVAGLGLTGSAAVEEILAAGTPLVVIDRDQERIDAAIQRFGKDLMFVVGDAFEEDTLLTAGIERALGMITALTDDRDNVMMCVTAHHLNPDIRIVAKFEDVEAVKKLRNVNIDAAVNPASMGGTRLANELLRPRLLAFTDGMLAPNRLRLRLEELTITALSKHADKPLSEAKVDTLTGCILLGLRRPDEETYRYHPAEDSVLKVGSRVMALGGRGELTRLRRLLAPPPPIELSERLNPLRYARKAADVVLRRGKP